MALIAPSPYFFKGMGLGVGSALPLHYPYLILFQSIQLIDRHVYLILTIIYPALYLLDLTLKLCEFKYIM